MCVTRQGASFRRIFGITLGSPDTHLNGYPLRLTLSLFLGGGFVCQSQERGGKKERNYTCAAIVWKRGAAEREGHLLPGWLSFTKWRCYFCVWKWDSTAADSGLHYSAPGFFFLLFSLSGASPSHCSSAPETFKKKRKKPVSQDQLVTSRDLWSGGRMRGDERRSRVRAVARRWSVMDYLAGH